MHNKLVKKTKDTVATDQLKQSAKKKKQFQKLYEYNKKGILNAQKAGQNDKRQLSNRTAPTKCKEKTKFKLKEKQETKT